MPDSSTPKTFVGTYYLSCAHDGCWQEFVKPANRCQDAIDVAEREGWARLDVPRYNSEGKVTCVMCPDHAGEAL